MRTVLLKFLPIARKERLVLFRRAFIDTLPVMMGYTTMGFAAGVLMSAKSGVPFAPFWAGFCGFAFISGTLSFAIVPAIAANASLFSIALLTLGINFRYMFYGFSVFSKWKDVPFFAKWFLIHSLADEIYALDVACPIKDKSKSIYYSLCNHALCALYLVAGTTLGAVVGSSVSIPSKGIEFAMIALFLVIFTDQLYDYFSRKSHR
jgi:4-azaleucine resistance transporter AzlC